MIIPKEQRLGYEYRNYHHYAAIILELGTVGKILVTASILDLSNFNILHVLHPYNLNLRMEDGHGVAQWMKRCPKLDLLLTSLHLLPRFT